MRAIFLAMTFAASGIAPAILTRWIGPPPAALSAPVPATVPATVPAADEARPRVEWELTTFQAAEPAPVFLEPVDMPFPLDGPADAPAVVRPSPQAVVTATPQAIPPPITYAAPAPAGDRVVSVTYGEPFIVSDSRQFTASYPQMPMTYAAPAPAMTYPQMSTSYGAPAAYSGMPGPAYADGGVPTGQAGPGAASIYIDAHSTLEHGPRFGIGNGLFRSGQTNRGGNTRGGGRGLFGGLFGRRGGPQGATYAAPTYCGPGGCY